VARLRRERGVRQEDLERALRATGLPWPPSTISRFENGNRDLSAGELLALPAALELALGEPVGWEELLGDAEIPVTDRLSVSAEELPHNTWADVKAAFPTYADLAASGLTWGDLAQPDQADRRAARRLRVPPAKIAALSRARWGRSMAAEREARLAARLEVDDHLDARGLRSAIGRELVAELREDLTTTKRKRRK
jgi:transcriptional regulator with XRE-family HTH domain